MKDALCRVFLKAYEPINAALGMLHSVLIWFFNSRTTKEFPMHISAKELQSVPEGTPVICRGSYSPDGYVYDVRPNEVYIRIPGVHIDIVVAVDRKFIRIPRDDPHMLHLVITASSLRGLLPIRTVGGVQKKGEPMIVPDKRPSVIDAKLEKIREADVYSLEDHIGYILERTRSGFLVQLANSTQTIELAPGDIRGISEDNRRVYLAIPKSELMRRLER